MSSALIVYGGWEGHEPDAASAFIAGELAGAGLRVQRTPSLDILSDGDALREFSVIVPCFTCGQLSASQEAGLCAAVESGVGLAGWHGGVIDAFRASPTYQFMTGGQFVAHPGNIIPYRVTITDRDHPITRGLSDFDITSEQYYLHVDPAIRPLAMTRFSGQHESKSWIAGVEMPVAWTKPWGRGRVFVSAIGHVTADLRIPAVTALTTRGILWAAGGLEQF